VRLRYWDFNGKVQDGELIVHRTLTDDVITAFRAIFDARFPIERMAPVDEYGGDDNRSMDANNTSAFNCRPATGSSRWSEHAYGRAIDINPRQNPYVTASGTVEPSAGTAFLDRTRPVPGLITSDGPVVAAFASVGWGWGGNWNGTKDYQHFSSTGR
jgi:D-alanyl-D-alanine carboxypeptidase